MYDPTPMTSVVHPFRKVDPSALAYGAMIKDISARLYIVPLEPGVTIQTTPVTLATSLEDAQVPFVYLTPDASLAAFFRAIEASVADACIAHKADWFAIAKTLEDDVLRRGFKSFFGPSGFKVKVPEDVACFGADKRPVGREDVPAGTVVRAVLELTRVCFGRHEYGATWTLVQLQVVPTQCLIDDEPVDDSVPADEVDNCSDSDINEFL